MGVLLGLGVDAAAAQELGRTPLMVEDPGEEGWRDHLEPARRRGQLYFRHGLAKVVEAMAPSAPEFGRPPTWLLYEQALVRLERARRLRPDDVEVAYLIAFSLSHWQRTGADGALERRVDEAIDAWHEVRRLDAMFQADRVAFELAVLRTIRGEIDAARVEYRRALDHAMEPPITLGLTRASARLASIYQPISIATTHGNLAEVTMLTGDVDAAIVHYRAALRTGRDPFSRALASWGLALALERSGAHEDAVREAAAAVRRDPITPDFPNGEALRRRHGPFAVLHIDGVFFEPAYEIHAYEALGHEALAREAGQPALVEESLRRALRSWRLFLTEGGRAGRFGEGARAAVQRIEAELSRAEGAPPSRR